MSSAVHPALIARFPRLRGLPWVRIGAWPTPVSRLQALGRRAGVDLWLKDDGRAGPRYGGNKVRKLEPLLAEALARGAGGVLTTGGIGSHHAVAAAVHAASLGLRTHAVLVPQPVTDPVRRNLALARALGVVLHPCGSRLRVPLTMVRVALTHPGLHVIGPGGSSPLGALGFVAGALELAAQVREGALPEPRELVVPLGSGGTAAGLSLGCALAGLATRVVAVRVVERPLMNATLVRWLVRATRSLMNKLGARVPGRAVRLEVVGGFVGRCYGDPTPEARFALGLARDLEGLKLETTYTAKALAALLARGSGVGPVLLWNTHNAHDLEPLLRGGPRSPLPRVMARWLEG